MNGPYEMIAPAKLTLSLRIVGVRDDGYHIIDAVMTTLELHDRLTITPTPSTGELTFVGPFAAGIPTDSTNLVARALRLVHRTASVTVTKNIPHGGGLGGGSADAAAVLRWAGFDDPTAASRLGADIPFCMAGGRARVRGIGEVIDPLPGTGPVHARDPAVVGQHPRRLRDVGRIGWPPVRAHPESQRPGGRGAAGGTATARMARSHRRRKRGGTGAGRERSHLVPEGSPREAGPWPSRGRGYRDDRRLTTYLRRW